MSKENKIIWKDSEVEKFFLESGLAKVADFFDIENGETKTKSMRKHLDKTTGEVNRQMTRIEINEKVYYLKQACKNAFINIINEFEAIDILPEFNLVPPKIAAYLLDEENKVGFILLKELYGYYPIKELIDGTAPKVAIDDFLERKEDILKQIAQRIRKVHKSGYAYPDWFAKHIFIKQESDEIALIDLERFRPLDKSPWYFGFPVTSFFVKIKFWRKLRKSLKSDILPDVVLKNILHE